MKFSGSLGHARSFLGWLWHQEFSILFVLLCLVGGVWGFIEIADEVIEGEARPFDTMILEQVRGVGPEGQPRGPVWLAVSMRDITALGSYSVLTLITAFCAVYLVLVRKKMLMLFTIGAALGGMLVSSLLKLLFSRERPEIALRLVVEQSYSFPSGHAMMSAVVYLSLAVMLSAMQPRLRERVFFLLAAMLLTFLVGVSRMYLGVHYPTDVLAGWAVGLAWASLWWFAGLHLRNRRGQISH
jgi:undecaprenyl-diphosphatase